MRNITKGNSPAYWLDLLKKRPRLSYNDLEPNHKQEKDLLKEHMLQTEQYYICCYCCKSIDEKNSHIEHFKSRHHKPQLSMKYDNLLVSCTSNTCGSAKKDQDFPKSLSYSNWQDRFKYDVDGHIMAVDNDADAELAIGILDLNNNKLVQMRRATYDDCINSAQLGKEYIKKQYIDMNDGHLPRFSPMIEYFYKMGHFDLDVVSTVQ